MRNDQNVKFIGSVVDREGKVPGKSIVAERIKSCKIDPQRYILQE